MCQIEEIIKSKIEELHQLQEVEGRMDVEKIRGVEQEVNNAMEQDELKWRQQAKEHWLKSGNKNTKFFHDCATQRQRTSKITIIEDEEGIARSSPEEIEVAFVNYYTNMFKSSRPTGLEECLRVLPRKVTDEMNGSLVRKFEVEEINSAI